jgi:hypothetical protein
VPGVEHGEGELVQRDNPPAGIALGLAGLDRPAELDELLGDGEVAGGAVRLWLSVGCPGTRPGNSQWGV